MQDRRHQSLFDQCQRARLGAMFSQGSDAAAVAAARATIKCAGTQVLHVDTQSSKRTRGSVAGDLGVVSVGDFVCASTRDSFGVVWPKLSRNR